MTVASAVRLCGLALHCFGRDPGGRSLSGSPLSELAVAAIYHLSALAALGLVPLALFAVAPRMRRWTTGFAAALFAVSIAVGQIDLGLLRYLGHHFSPAIAGTYIGAGTFTPELWQPLLFDWPYVLRSVALIGAGWVLLAIVWARCRVDVDSTAVSWRVIASMLLMAGGGFLVISRVEGQSQQFQPPEAAFLALVNEGTPPPHDESAAREALHRRLDPDGTAVWTDSEYPLVHRPSAGPGASTTDLPDVVVLMVESLRGRDVGYTGLRVPSLTPNLDRLASRSVQFPRFVANGFPTAPAFFTLNTGLWSHRTWIMTKHFRGTHVDALPRRLAKRGYHCIWIDGGNPGFDNELSWGNEWFDETIHDLPENRWLYVKRMNDQVFLQRAIETMARHDQSPSHQPLFLFLSTAGMHPPFTLGDSLFEPLTAMGDASRMDTMSISDPQRRYDLVLSAFDRALGTFLDAIDRRARRDRTVLVVTGDHSSFTSDTLDPALRGLPTDETEWTSALINGPPDLVGPSPRIEPFAASQVDVMPTILALVGDSAPTAAMGRNLVDGRRNGRTSVAIRPAGYRLDRGGSALIVSGNDHDLWWTLTPFGSTASARRGFGKSGFAMNDVEQLRRDVDYVSYLIERDRIWPPR